MRKRVNDPMDTPLPCEVICGPIRFSKGVRLRTLVEAAERWRNIAQNHIMCCHDSDGSRAALDAFKTAMTKYPDVDGAYALGVAVGLAYCNAAANDGMGDNPFPPGMDADRWQEGFNHGVEIWEESN
jgi:hypothetical protein